ncbi:hypothetical protein M231_04567 [Tremella mesenterica]|uniref:Uncharacterized protein n=1 Tax=Tremella mesenterica TaxID=5217 RepID=A0A4Q1BK91_TREME|nr:hypothetical protein M231_04567 [Tremella mesenterica]
MSTSPDVTSEDAVKSFLPLKILDYFDAPVRRGWWTPNRRGIASGKEPLLTLEEIRAVSSGVEPQVSNLERKFNTTIMTARRACDHLSIQHVIQGFDSKIYHRRKMLCQAMELPFKTRQNRQVPLDQLTSFHQFLTELRETAGALPFDDLSLNDSTVLGGPMNTRGIDLGNSHQNSVHIPITPMLKSVNLTDQANQSARLYHQFERFVVSNQRIVNGSLELQQAIKTGFLDLAQKFALIDSLGTSDVYLGLYDSTMRIASVLESMFFANPFLNHEDRISDLAARDAYIDSWLKYEFPPERRPSTSMVRETIALVPQWIRDGLTGHFHMYHPLSTPIGHVGDVRQSGLRPTTFLPELASSNHDMLDHKSKSTEKEGTGGFEMSSYNIPPTDVCYSVRPLVPVIVSGLHNTSLIQSNPWNLKEVTDPRAAWSASNYLGFEQGAGHHDEFSLGQTWVSPQTLTDSLAYQNI